MRTNAGFLTLLLLTSSLTYADSVDINLSPQDTGRVFDGIGALSGGASSRLLIDYPEPQRSQILDFLFKPAFGAGFQDLKVEIPGDINSTCGSEPSQAHTREEFEHPKPAYFNRGYEWWLMEEAKKRNPNITLGILEWGAPGWIGALADPNADWGTAGRKKYYTKDNADYIVAFIKAARDQHGLRIDYTGIWNENDFDAEWIKLLRRTLDREGLSNVKIDAADLNNESRIAEAMVKDPDLLKDVDIIGVHYPERHLGPQPAALQTGKTIWASEDGYSDTWNDKHFPYMIQAYIRNYIDSRMTSTIIWSLITAYYDWTRDPNSGPLRAVEPWSGHYEVQDGIWFTAHMTQFIKPGWRFLDHACALLAGKGSYVSLVAPSGGDYSMVFETIGAPAPQQLTVHLDSGLSHQPLHVWTSDVNARFVHGPDLKPSGDSFSLTLPPDTILSLSTQGGQQKGAVSSIPTSQPFPFPYHDDFESYQPGKLPKYFSDQTGSFAVAQRADGKGQCYRQVVPQPGIDWHYPNWEPTTFLGDVNWKDYSVACDARIENHGWVTLYGHVVKAITVVKGKKAMPAPPPGCWLRVDENGQWQLVSYDKKKVDHQLVLARGTCAFSANTWHHLEIDFQGDQIAAKIDGAALGSAKTAYRNGAVGLGSDWNYADFDNFVVQPLKP